jgi:hypothetical protein
MKDDALERLAGKAMDGVMNRIRESAGPLMVFKEGQLEKLAGLLRTATANDPEKALDPDSREYALALIDMIYAAEEYGKTARRFMWIMMRQRAQEELKPKKDA